jgi:hypothetical protein
MKRLREFAGTVSAGKVIAVAVTLIALSAMLATPAQAQVTTGSISGTVVDQSGAAVPGATVTATNRATHSSASVGSNETGYFKLNFLAVGSYDVVIERPSFRTERVSAAEVNVNADNSIGNIKIELGSASATVEVTAAPPLIEANTAQVTNTFESQQVTGFAGVNEFQGLDFLALQVPGVVSTRDLGFSNVNGPGFSVNGLRGENNDQQVDGQNNNDNSVGGPSLFISNSDWISEYQIVTNNFGAEYGRNAGSVVNEITKSGTNTWHGTVSDVENNSYLNTMTNSEKYFQGLSKVPWSNFSAPSSTIGGPLWKDRVFVFGGFDAQIAPTFTNYSSSSLTPTPAGVTALAGCYPGSSAVTALQTFGPFAISGGNPQSLPGTVTTAYSDLPPVPNGTDPVTGNPACVYGESGIERLLSTSFHEYDWVYKMDIALGTKDRLFGRYIFQKSNYEDQESGNAAAGYPFNVPALAQLALADWTHTFSARAFNQFRASWGRVNVEFGGNSLGTMPTSQNLGDSLASIGFQAAGLLAWGVPSGDPDGRIVTTYQIQDNFSFTKGRNQFKTGVNWTRQYSPNIFLPNYNGVYTFSDWGGLAANVSATTAITQGNPELDFLEHDTFLYFGDDWKVKDNLTINLGLTWSYYGQPANLIHDLSVKDQTGSSPFWDPSLPLSDTTIPALPSVKHLFGPSAGFAYTPHFWEGLFGHDKTVIRGGYRLAFDPPFYNIYILFPYFAPLSLSQTIGNPNTGVPGTPLLADPTGTNVRASLASDLTPGVFDPRSLTEYSLAPNFGPDHVQSWSLGVQREVAKGAAIEFRYVGNHADNLFQSINQNPYVSGIQSLFPNEIPSGVTACTSPNVAPPPAGGPSPALGRANCNLGVSVQLGNFGYSDYQAFQAELRTTDLWHQLTLQTAYTYSKNTDNASAAFQTTFAAGSSLAFSQNPFNYESGDHGISGLDFPQSWTMSFNEQIPAFRHQQGIVGHILGGWAVAGTYGLTSGQAFTPIQLYLQSLSYFAEGVIPPNDYVFNSSVVGPYDFARPFWGNPSAPANSVGVYAGDECGEQLEFGAAPTIPVCTTAPTTLISLNALNASGTITPVTKNQVRYIGNGAISDSVFGSSLGTVARNVGRDAWTNAGNFALYKNIKFTERNWVQFHVTMLNVFNHPNYASVDPIIEDAGLTGQSLGFGTPNLTNSGGSPTAIALRQILFGLKVVF